MQFRLVGEISEAFSIIIDADTEEEAFEQLKEMSVRGIRANAETIGGAELNPDSLNLADVLTD